MNLECRLRVRNPARRQIGASSKVRQERSNLLPLPRNLHFFDMNNCSKRIQIPEILSMSPFFSKHEFLLNPRCLKGAIPEYYGYMNYYQLLPCFVYRILCVHSCVTHLLTNKAVLMGELPHPSHPSHLVSGKHSSSIPHSCSPIDGLVHPNSWPFTPSSFLSLLQSPKLSF